MDSVQPIIKTRLLARMWRIITGKVACCACGHWVPAQNDQTRASGGRTWYCDCCGELIRRARTGFYFEIFVFLVALVMTLPLFVRIPDWMFDNGTASAWLILVILFSWFLTSYLIATYYRASFDEATATKMAEPYGHCLRCDYDLNYAVSERCPECGASAVHVLEAIGKKERRGALARHE